MLKKGSGYHLDILVIGLLTMVGGFMGSPFMVAATVRSVAHISSLSVFSRTHAPGETPKLERVYEQRLTALAVHILIGKSFILFYVYCSRCRVFAEFIHVHSAAVPWLLLHFHLSSFLHIN